MDDRIFDTITIYAPVVLVVLSAINAATKHYTKFNGLLKLLMEIIERLSVLSSKNTRGRFKMLGTSVTPDVDMERMENAKKQLEAMAKWKDNRRYKVERRR